MKHISIIKEKKKILQKLSSLYFYDKRDTTRRMNETESEVYFVRRLVFINDTKTYH